MGRGYSVPPGESGALGAFAVAPESVELLRRMCAAIHRQADWPDRAGSGLGCRGDRHSCEIPRGRRPDGRSAWRPIRLAAADLHPESQSLRARPPRRRPAAITRKLRLLRAHGLIHKAPKTYRYRLTEVGRKPPRCRRSRGVHAHVARAGRPACAQRSVNRETPWSAGPSL